MFPHVQSISAIRLTLTSVHLVPQDSTHLHLAPSRSAGSCPPLVGCSRIFGCVSASLCSSSQTPVKCCLLAGTSSSLGTRDASMIRQALLWEDVKLCTPHLRSSRVCVCVCAWKGGIINEKCINEPLGGALLGGVDLCFINLCCALPAPP